MAAWRRRCHTRWTPNATSPPLLHLTPSRPPFLLSDLTNNLTCHWTRALPGRGLRALQVPLSPWSAHYSTTLVFRSTNTDATAAPTRFTADQVVSGPTVQSHNQFRVHNLHCPSRHLSPLSLAWSGSPPQSLVLQLSTPCTTLRIARVASIIAHAALAAPPENFQVPLASGRWLPLKKAFACFFSNLFFNGIRFFSVFVRCFLLASGFCRTKSTHA